MFGVPVYIIILSIFLLLIIIEVFSNHRHPFWNALLGSFLGIAALICTNIAAAFTGVKICISVLSLAIASLAGIPGVAMMIIIDLIT